ncbi:MAG: hypothetical protein EOM64_10115, partial [Erysipelotrichia bacterium]|nr:hypothetical protein [Erysipelotrichia bacterium]
DVYRKEIVAERNPFRYALFVSFFPQLVAGPIERSKNLLSQLQVTHTFSFERMRSGLLMMLWGLFQKMVIADRAAILVDQVYGQYQAYAGYTLVVATVLFAIQIYCDFGGYSCIAIGAAEVLGIDLMTKVYDTIDCFMKRSRIVNQRRNIPEHDSLNREIRN